MKWIASKFTGYLIRIGPDIEKYGDSYLWCVPVSDAGELTGFSSTPPTPTGLKTAIRAAITLGFQNPVIDRRGIHPRTLICGETEQQGVITMKDKMKIPTAQSAFKPDGRPNYHAIIDAVKLLKEQEELGHYTVTGTASEVQNADGSIDGTMTFKRIPANPSVAAK